MFLLHSDSLCYDLLLMQISFPPSSSDSELLKEKAKCPFFFVWDEMLVMTELDLTDYTLFKGACMEESKSSAFVINCELF